MKNTIRAARIERVVFGIIVEVMLLHENHEPEAETKFQFPSGSWRGVIWYADGSWTEFTALKTVYHPSMPEIPLCLRKIV